MTKARIDLPRPIRFGGGEAVAIEFSRATVGDMIELTKRGDFLAAETASEFAARFGSAVTQDGQSFPITRADIDDNLSPAPAMAAAMALAKLIEHDSELGDGEAIAMNPLSGEGATAIRLRYPVRIEFTVGTEDRAFDLEWLTFQPQKYRDASEFVRSYLRGAPETTALFLSRFGTMMNVPDGYPMTRMTESQAHKVDASDGERIAALVMPGFIEMPA